MKILFVSSAGSPILGSTHALTWKWLGLIAASHDVTLLTDPEFKDDFNAAENGHGVHIEFVPFRQPRKVHWFFRAYAYQYKALRTARRLHAERCFDLVHTFTPDSWRIPSFMWRLGIPSVWGPVGGGENFPLNLLRILDLNGSLAEIVRAISQRLSIIDPILRSCAQHHSLVLTENMSTRKKVVQLGAPQVLVESAQVMLLPRTPMATRKRTSILQMVYAGALIPRKGIPLGIRAVKMAKSRGMSNLRWDIYGSGPMMEKCRALISQLQLEDVILLRGKVSHAEMGKVYPNYDVYFFPSLRDACGTSLIEALSMGLPVICLDNSGPAEIVNHNSGIACSSEGTPVAVVERLAEAIREIATNGRVKTLGDGTIPRLQEMGFAPMDKAKSILEKYERVARGYDCQ